MALSVANLSYTFKWRLFLYSFIYERIQKVATNQVQLQSETIRGNNMKWFFHICHHFVSESKECASPLVDSFEFVTTTRRYTLFEDASWSPPFALPPLLHAGGILHTDRQTSEKEPKSLVHYNPAPPPQ